MKFKIDTNIPIPNRFFRADNAAVAKLMRTMKTGESILIPGSRANAANLARANLGPGRYTARKEKKGFRVWKTK